MRFEQLFERKEFDDVEKEISKYNIEYNGEDNTLKLYNVKYDNKDTENLTIINLNNNKKHTIKNVGKIISSRSIPGAKGVMKYTKKHFSIRVIRDKNTIEIIDEE